jgi:hypothetical protein
MTITVIASGLMPARQSSFLFLFSRADFALFCPRAGRAGAYGSEGRRLFLFGRLVEPENRDRSTVKRSTGSFYGPSYS